jgi:hypothetical protein
MGQALELTLGGPGDAQLEGPVTFAHSGW